ncbi:hypothetical protein E5288_WYG005061 [Bos mutus]|uniref:Uncharacterized protein n=1 Tax=Bos mutus TaxID=72004 RepID=A0A6B0SFE5_9CETA|nr:hypothetical protein [Bos mutus]
MGSASSGREDDAAGRDSNSRERALLGDARVIKESIFGWEQRTHLSFSARSSDSECEHNTEKRQDDLQAFGTGD